LLTAPRVLSAASDSPGSSRIAFHAVYRSTNGIDHRLQFKLEEACTHKSAKSHAEEIPASSGKRCLWGGVLQPGKPGVVYVRSNSGNIAFCLKTDTDVLALTFKHLTQK